MGNIYHPMIVKERIAELEKRNEVQDNGEMKDGADRVGFAEIFTSDKYKRATFVGCVLAVLQQTTGINPIMFFSNSLLFKGLDFELLTFF